MRGSVAVIVVSLCLAAPSFAVAGDWTWPLRGEVLTPYLSGGDPYATGQHRGVDIAGAIGEPVVAATAGSVRFAGPVGSSGLTIAIRTADGRYDTSYLHLSAARVSGGERVSAGQVVGAIGASGRRSAAAPHLHFGIRVAGSDRAYRDPLDFLPPLARVREGPRGVPVRVTAPIPLGPAPEPVPVRRPVRWLRPVSVPRPEPAGCGLGWPAVGAGCLVALAVLVGGVRAAAARPARSSIGARAVLRHNADLLRQR
jgi:Peptidase family M23